jgi:hypothetical protein
MIAWAFGSEMGVGKFWRPLRRVGVLAMPKKGLNTMGCIESRCEIPPGAGEPRIAVGVFIDHRCVADGVELTHWVISATWEFFSKDNAVVFGPWIADAMELSPWEESLSPAGTEMQLWAGGSWKISQTPIRLLSMVISKACNISYDWSRVRVRPLGMHHSIWMCDVRTLGLISSAGIYQSRWLILLFEQS